MERQLIDALPIECPVPEITREVGHPAQVSIATWRDPVQIAHGSERQAREVRGYRRSDVLRRMKARGCRISDEHIAAAEKVRIAYEVATIGLTPGGLGIYAGAGIRHGSGPRGGLSAAQQFEVACWTNYRRVVRRIGPAQEEILVWVVLCNHDISSWCERIAQRTGRRVDRKIETGRLLALLDMLVEHYASEIAEDRLMGREPA
jgi:hypothetical protein